MECLKAFRDYVPSQRPLDWTSFYGPAFSEKMTSYEETVLTMRGELPKFKDFLAAIGGSVKQARNSCMFRTAGYILELNSCGIWIG
jgi:hypothetical protein